MAASDDELVTLKPVKDNQAFKKINSEYSFSVIYPDVSDTPNTMICLNKRTVNMNGRRWYLPMRTLKRV